MTESDIAPRSALANGRSRAPSQAKAKNRPVADIGAGQTPILTGPPVKAQLATRDFSSIGGQMVSHPGLAEQAAGHLSFMLDNADMIYPLLLSVPSLAIVLMFKSVRDRMKEPVALAAFVGVFLLWVALIPWGALWLDAMDIRHASPKLAGWPITVVFFGWPIVAVTLIVRAKGARIASAFYVLSNVPGWLLGCFVCAMAVSGDWI